MNSVEDTPIDQKEIKGLNARTLLAIAIGMITIEATLLGVYYGVKESIKDVNYMNIMQDKRMDLLESRQDKLEARQEYIINHLPEQTIQK